MRKYRTEIGIILEILTVIQQDEVTLGHIMKAVNVPYTRLSAYINTLISYHLIEKVSNGNNTSYTITKKGREFVSEAKKFGKLLSIYGLKF